KDPACISQMCPSRLDLRTVPVPWTKSSTAKEIPFGLYERFPRVPVCDPQRKQTAQKPQILRLEIAVAFLATAASPRLKLSNSWRRKLVHAYSVRGIGDLVVVLQKHHHRRR